MPTVEEEAAEQDDSGLGGAQGQVLDALKAAGSKAAMAAGSGRGRPEGKTVRHAEMQRGGRAHSHQHARPG